MSAKFDVQPLFIEPVYRENIGEAITGEQEAFIKSLKMNQNKTNLISENLYIFDHPKLRSIKKAVQQSLDTYAEQVMGIPQKLYITQSWSLLNQPGMGMNGHSHSNSIVSGSLYFCDLPEPNANMIFSRHNNYQQLEIVPAGDKRNLYNTPVNVVTPKKHDVILFSSSLQHFVEPNNSTQPRYSIAFNTFIKGKLGDMRDVSELTLQ